MMRLTLRTLLAYLDDILEPTEAKEIGAKIAESSYASSLVTKIKDVVRRRRISAPEVSGPGSTPDANLIAEYLDNTLAPDSVADLERVCLESDSHLAEVAACHQVLTLVLGEPVDIPGGMRERMYALGAVAAPDDSNGMEAPGAHVPTIAGVGAADVTRDLRPGSGEVSLEDRLPEALLPRRRSWLRALPYAVGILVIGAWGYLFFNDEAFTGAFTAKTSSPEPAGNPEVDLSPGPRPTNPSVDVAAPGTGDGLAGRGPDAESPIPAAAVTAPDLTRTPPPMPEEGLPIDPAATVPTVAVTPQTSGSPSGEAVVTTAPPVAPQPDAFLPPIQELAVLAEPWQLKDVSTAGVLLQFQAAAEDWFVMARKSLIFPGEEIAAPAPFDATLHVGDGGAVAEVTLRGGTRIRSLGTTDDGRIGFEITQGRIVIRLPDSAPADEPVPLRIVVREDVFKLELLQPGTIVGVEVNPILPTGEGDRSGATSYNGGFALIAGSGRLTSADGRLAVDLRPNAGWLEFFAAGDEAPIQPEPLVGLPGWLDLQAPATLTPARRYAARYEDEFIADQPISQSIRPVVKDRRALLAELATQTLALGGSYPGLVDALTSVHEEARLAAILGLKQWLPLDAENGTKLRTELQNRFRGADAATLERLLWGFGEQDARNQFVSEELVEWLAHDEIAVRELAYFHVHRLTDRSHDYRPNNSAPQRARAVQSWRRHVRENGALIGD